MNKNDFRVISAYVFPVRDFTHVDICCLLLCKVIYFYIFVHDEREWCDGNLVVNKTFIFIFSSWLNVGVTDVRSTVSYVFNSCT
ncbi:hypothetical protein D3C86_2060950 [compost metagenome]